MLLWPLIDNLKLPVFMAGPKLLLTEFGFHHRELWKYDIKIHLCTTYLEDQGFVHVFLESWSIIPHVDPDQLLGNVWKWNMNEVKNPLLERGGTTILKPCTTSFRGNIQGQFAVLGISHDYIYYLMSFLKNFPTPSYSTLSFLDIPKIKVRYLAEN